MKCPRVSQISVLAFASLLPITPLASATTPHPSIEVWAASPSMGIVGAINQGITRLEFESKLVDSTLRSEIRTADGHLLWLYMENFESDGPPNIEIDGKPFVGRYNSEVRQVVDRLAASPEGELIRALAFDLSDHIGGRPLMAYRRGLETAYQAIQRGYPDEQWRRSPKRKEHSAVADHSEGHSPDSTSGFQTEDYIFSEHGGYVVKTQHHQAVFANNFLSDDHEKVQNSIGKLPVKPEDDDSIHDSCFGMCGNGCSSAWSCRGFEGWSHEWVGQPTLTVTAWCGCNLPDHRDDPDCANFVPGTFKTTISVTSGDAIHTITGWSSDGCIAHDWCCRNLIGGCLNPTCIELMLWAGADCAANIGWEVRWSYIGNLTYRYETVESTTCRYDCPACGDSTIPPPMQVDP